MCDVGSASMPAVPGRPSPLGAATARRYLQHGKMLDGVHRTGQGPPRRPSQRHLPALGWAFERRLLVSVALGSNAAALTPRLGHRVLRLRHRARLMTAHRASGSPHVTPPTWPHAGPLGPAAHHTTRLVRRRGQVGQRLRSTTAGAAATASATTARGTTHRRGRRAAATPHDGDCGQQLDGVGMTLRTGRGLGGVPHRAADLERVAARAASVVITRHPHRVGPRCDKHDPMAVVDAR